MRRAKEKKGVEAQKVKPPTPILAIDALIGDEEQNENRKKNKKKERVAPGGSTDRFPLHFYQLLFIKLKYYIYI